MCTLQPGDIARQLGASAAEVETYKKWLTQLTPTEKMAALRRQGVPERLIERELGADYQAPATTNA